MMNTNRPSRSHSAVLAAGLLAFGGCAASTPDWANGTPVTVESWAAPDSVDSDQKSQAAVAGAIAVAKADVLCMNGAFGNQQAIVDAAKANYPYAYFATSTLDAKPDDPTDVHGNPVALYSTPPCTSPAALTKVDGAIACLEKNCSTIANSDSGKLTSLDCYTQSCISSGIALLGADSRCFLCSASAITNAGRTFADTRSWCTTQVNGERQYGGQSGSILLSRYPLSATRSFLLPSSVAQATVLGGTVTLPSGATFDAYCSALTFPQTGLTSPYVGQWGDGEKGDDGWVNEEDLQAKQLATFVQKQSGTRPAVIAGTFYGSHESRNAADQVVVAANNSVKVLDRLKAQFTEATPPGYVPACTRCPDNAWYTAPGSMSPDPWWTDRVFLWNVPASAVVAASVDQKMEPSWQAGARALPPSPLWGFQATVKIAR